MNEEPELFKIDSKGKIRVLYIDAIGDEVIRRAGIYQGNLVRTGKVCKGKNIGRSNETTPSEQAELEAAAERTKKIREGYVLVPDYSSRTLISIADYIQENSLDIPDCMLAKDYKDSYARWDEGILLSTKLDGMRCMAVITNSGVTLYSRGRKEITIMNHIVAELEEFRKATRFTGILDGELYYHNPNADNFQAIMKACKKYRKGVTELVQYHVYELVDNYLSAEERYAKLWLLLGGEKNDDVVKLVPQHKIYTYDFAIEMHNKFVADGFEGAILKNANSAYRQGTRSSDLLKLKVFTESEFEIMDIVAMDNYPKQGKAVLKDSATGLIFNAIPKMTHSERVALLINRDKIVGHTAVVKYFGLTDKGIPRIASLKSIITPDSTEDFRLINK